MFLERIQEIYVHYMWQCSPYLYDRSWCIYLVRSYKWILQPDSIYSLLHWKVKFYLFTTWRNMGEERYSSGLIDSRQNSEESGYLKSRPLYSRKGFGTHWTESMSGPQSLSRRLGKKNISCLESLMFSAVYWSAEECSKFTALLQFI
jgi:hypothetical protein